MAQQSVTLTAPARSVAEPSAHAERDARTEELFTALAGATDPQARAAVVEKVIVLYLDLCTSMASRYDGRGVEHDDLVQVARLALVKAVDRYVPGQGPSFAAFAVPTISGELKRHFRDRGWMVRPPRRLQELRVQVQTCRTQLEQSLGHAPTDFDVAEALGLSVHTVKEAVAASGSFHPTSLDAGTGDDDTGSISYLLGGEDGELGRVDDRVCIESALAALDPVDRELLTLRFVQELTQREIGVRVGRSQMQVSRSLRRLIEHLRVSLADEADQDAARTDHAS